jgi:polyisoprenoid-binding protein YceI
MALTPGTRSLGPENGTLEIRTYRDGIAQAVGHDLIIDVDRWQATVEVGDDGAPTSIALDVDPRSLKVREGLRGVKPLTDKDRRDILGTIDQKVLLERPITFRSTAVQSAGDRLTVQGELTIVGKPRPATFELRLDQSGRVSGTLPIMQSQWGIKPYRGLMGALKVRDAVEVVLDVALASG